MPKPSIPTELHRSQHISWLRAAVLFGSDVEVSQQLMTNSTICKKQIHRGGRTAS